MMTDQIKRMTENCIIAIFFLILCAAYPTSLLFGEASDVSVEKRVLSPAPTFSWETIESYPTALEAYVNDRLPYRRELIHANSMLSYYVLGTSPTRLTIQGKDGWLFYGSVTDGDSIACYKGTNLYTAEELAAIAAKLETLHSALLKEGKEFVLFIPPNKERIYSEYMPDVYGEPASEYRMKQLTEYLRENTAVRVVCPETELAEAKTMVPEYNAYYKLDTHWNYIGGYEGCRALCKALSIELPPASTLSYTDTEPTIADLADNMNLRKELNVVPDFTISGYDRYHLVCDEHEMQARYIYHNDGADERGLYMVGDSFMDAMDDFTAAQFSHTEMVHYSKYVPGDMLKTDAKVVVYEMVERRLGELLTVQF